jgi:PAS domain S-box-containing protein
MHDQSTVAHLLDLEPRLRDSGEADASPEAMRALLGEAQRALHAAVGELRAAREALVERPADVPAPAPPAAQPAPDDAFRMAFASSPDALVLTDAEGTIRHANPAAGALLGVRRDDLAGMQVEGFVADDARARVREVLTMLRGSIEPRRLALQLRPRRRLPVTVEACAWACHTGDAAVAWSLRAPAEGEGGGGSHGEAAALRSLLDSLPVAAAAMDLDGTVLTWNRAAQRLLGWTEDDLAGRRNPSVDDDLLHRLDGLRAVGPEAAPFHASAEVERKDGAALKVDLVLAPLADVSGTVTGTVAVMHPAVEITDGASSREDRQPWSPDELRRVLLRGGRAGDFAERLRAGITAGVHVGHLRAGDRLPSIREAAHEAGADHRVVSAAYQRLAADGLVEIRNRRGVVVAGLPNADGPELGETAEWLARVLEESSALQVRVPHLPELVRRWTAGVPLKVACVDATDDARTALAHEISHQWGMQASAVPMLDAADPGARQALAEAIRQADLVLTSTFHAHAVRPVADSLGKPLVVATANPEMVATVEARLRRGPVTAVVSDEAYGERLRAFEGGERLRVVAAGDADALAALDPNEPVVATMAALKRLAKPLRLLVPAGHFVSPVSARAIARVLIRANLDAARVRE